MYYGEPCIVCGRQTGDPDTHKCPPTTIRRLAREERDSELRKIENIPSFQERLASGFFMLDDNEDPNPDYFYR